MTDITETPWSRIDATTISPAALGITDAPSTLKRVGICTHATLNSMSSKDFNDKEGLQMTVK